jgi:hypothetical protein
MHFAALIRGRASDINPTCPALNTIVPFAACLSLALSLDGTVTAVAQVVDSKFELFVTDTAESIRFYETLGFSVALVLPHPANWIVSMP